MKIVFMWDEFVQAAIERLCEKHPDMRSGDGKPEFMQKYGYEPDGTAYTFPPNYVQFEITLPHK